MKKQHNPMSIQEKKLHLTGLIITFGLFLLSILFSHLATPLLLLQIRLVLLITGFIYFLCVFIYYEFTAVGKGKSVLQLNDIIIIINGKELRR